MEELKQSEHNKSCANCGAELNYKPGSNQLECAYCGYEEFIEQSKSSFEELELQHYLKVVGDNAYTETIDLLHCKNCGANQHTEENYKSLECIYCSEPLIREDVEKQGWIMPSAVVPFQIDEKKAQQIFKSWSKTLWFAPNKLQRAALDVKNLHGIYLPFWTFDANMTADYQGQRGDYYYVTESYQTSKGRKTRQVRKTRWSFASGSVKGFVDDILINASVKKQKEIPSEISQWNLKELVNYNSKYLTGFITEKYTLSLKDGHNQSFKKAKDKAYNWIRSDIGGDTQRISHADIELADETFKHILLPIYISSYIFNDKKYEFYINGQTGRISSKRPYSFWKIFFLVLAILIVVAIIVLVSQQNK